MFYEDLGKIGKSLVLLFWLLVVAFFLWGCVGLIEEENVHIEHYNACIEAGNEPTAGYRDKWVCRDADYNVVDSWTYRGL